MSIDWNAFTPWAACWSAWARATRSGLVALGMGEALLFVAAMLAGMGLFELIERRPTPRTGARSAQ